MDTINPIKLFGKNLFGFWLPFIGFTTYVEYDDIFNPKYKEYVFVYFILGIKYIIVLYISCKPYKW